MKVKVDLTEERPARVLIGYDEDDNWEGRMQDFQYEEVPNYCKFFKYLGHTIMKCLDKNKNDEVKRRKKMEEVSTW